MLTEKVLIFIFHCVVVEILSGQARGQVDHDYLPSELDCPNEKTKMMAKEVPWGVPGRAYLTLPPGLRIAPSPMPDAGLGIISDTFIKKFTWLGQYEGETLSGKYKGSFSPYTWSVTRNNVLMNYLDGYHLDRSSFLRYINTPNRHSDENVLALECMTRMFYMVSKDIVPGTELLVDYGLAYQQDLNIDLNSYYNVSAGWRTSGLDLNNITHRYMLYSMDLEMTDLSEDEAPSSLEFVTFEEP